MHITIEFSCEKPVTLPFHYNHIVQGFIYNTIDERLADFLHEKGYGEGRNFKLFCFSNIIEKAHIKSESGRIIFGRKVSFVISSPVDYFCESFANGLFKRTLILGENILEVESIKIDRQQINSDIMHIETISPVTAYSTLVKADGRKYTCFFQPGEEDFRRIVEENLRKKYRAFTGREPSQELITIKTLGQTRQHIVLYKGFIIKGYTGRLLMSGPQELLQMALDAGLGGKNSQGFGCVRLV